MGGSKRVGVTTNKEHHKKLVLMYQVSLCEFQREFKFGMEEKSDGRNREDALCGEEIHRF